MHQDDRVAIAFVEISQFHRPGIELSRNDFRNHSK